MQKGLERRLEEMDAWRDALVGRLSGLSAERLAFRPEGKGWCALDVVQHLVLVEEGVLGYARKKLQGSPQAVSLVDRAKLVSLVLVLKSPVRFRAPAPQVVPAETFLLPELEARWRTVRGGLRDLLGGLPEERLSALLFRHPLGGPLDAAGTLTFLDEHARHHDAQLRRIWRATGCPG